MVEVGSRPSASDGIALAAGHDGGDMKVVREVTAILVLVFGWAVIAAAQERHVVSPEALASTIAEHVKAQDTQRAAILATLSRPEVQSVAKRVGIDVEALQTGLAAVDADKLGDIAARAEMVDQSLVGGASTITISTTTIIIVLLIVILILVID
jgi:hypothetical protein